MSLVTVKPLPLKKWHNKVGNEAFGQARVLEALYDPNTGHYATGLEDLEEDKIKELSNKLGGVRLDNIFSTDEPHPFWTSKVAWVKLPNATIVFNTEKPIDFIKVKLLKASKYVANSLKQFEDGNYPDATHYIEDEEEEMAIKASKGQKLQRASEMLLKMSADDKINIIQIVLNKNLKGKSNNFIDAEIYSILNENIDDFFRCVELGKEKLYTKARVKELLQKNILTKQGTGIYYMGDVIGTDEDDAIRWFNDPNNTNIKIAILDKLNRK